MTLLLFAAGLIALIVGAELLVRGASRIALMLRIPPLLVGLTIAAYGTSSPEAAVTLRAALAGQADVALGNIAGSNILNVLVILGIGALLRPLTVQIALLRRDVPIMIAASLLVILMALDGRLGRIDGALLAGGAALYTVFTIIVSRRDAALAAPTATRAVSRPAVRVLGLALLSLAGLALLVLGARWLVDAAGTLARSLGVSDLVIGLTIVAAGTSLPELATSIVALVRGEREIAVGNVVGSNIFNVLFVLGCAGLVAPAGVAVSADVLRLDLPFALVAAMACLPVFLTGGVIDRWEGALFLAAYAGYLGLVLLRARGGLDSTVTVLILASLALAVLGATAHVVLQRSRRPSVG